MSIQTKAILNLTAIVLLVGAAVYFYYGINKLSQMFTDGRKSEAQFFTQLIRDNWDGIHSIPDEKKTILIANLDPANAGSDIDPFRILLIMFALLFFGVAIIGRLVALYKLSRVFRNLDISS
jgi:hypothetical protein